MDHQHGKREALRRSLREARTITERVQWVIGGTAILAFVTLLIFAHARFFMFGHVWVWLFKGAAALGAGVAVKLSARRARGAVRQLPDPEAVEMLRPLAQGEDETDRRIARELMKGLRPEGTEVVAASAPEGRGSEVAVEPAAEHDQPA